MKTRRAGFMILSSAFLQSFSARTAEIPNSVLRTAIRKELGKPNGEVRDLDMESLTKLSLSGRGAIESFEELEHAVNLTHLALDGNSMPSVALPEGLHSLKGLADGIVVAKSDRLEHLTGRFP